jgi:hypothetical protein
MSLVEPLPVKMQWLYPTFKSEGKGENQVLTGKTLLSGTQCKISLLQGHSFGQSHLLEAQDMQDKSRACFVTLVPSPMIISAMVMALYARWQWLKQMSSL